MNVNQLGDIYTNLGRISREIMSSAASRDKPLPERTEKQPAIPPPETAAAHNRSESSPRMTLARARETLASTTELLKAVETPHLELNLHQVLDPRLISPRYI